MDAQKGPVDGPKVDRKGCRCSGSRRKEPLPNQMLSEGIAATQEVEGRGHHHTGSGRKGPPNHQKLQEGLVDTPEMDESAENLQKWTKGPVNAPEVPPQQQKLTECLLTFQK